MIVEDMRAFIKFLSQVMNSKLYRTLPPPIRYLEKWKICIWHCPMFAESNRTVSNSRKMTILITILLGEYSSLRLVVPPINYAWLNTTTIVLCFSDSVETQFRLFLLVFLPRNRFFRLSSRLLLKSFQDLAFRDVILPVLINNCVVLKVHARFPLNGELVLIPLTNKQTLPL